MKEHPTVSESEKAVADTAIREFDKDGRPEAKQRTIAERNAQEVINLAKILELLQEIEQLKQDVINAKLLGYEAALEMYAWWKDGILYVGSTGKTLKKALEQAPVDCTRI